MPLSEHEKRLLEQIEQTLAASAEPYRTLFTVAALTGAQVQALRRSVQAFKALGGGWTPSAPFNKGERAILEARP